MARRLLTAVVLGLVIGCIPVAGAEVPLTGTYSSTLTADDVKGVTVVRGDQLVGKWTLVFNSDGTYEVRLNDVTHVKGTFTLKDDELTLTDKTGDFACVEGDNPQGVYKITRSALMLTFEKVKDETCPGRASAMTLKPFTSAK